MSRRRRGRRYSNPYQRFPIPKSFDQSTTSVSRLHEGARLHIRVLQLQPASSLEDPLRGRFVVGPISEWQDKYDALSYTWQPPFEDQVIVDDALRLDDKARLSVTGNLGRALRYLRQSSASIALWVDAICINQLDVVERSQQVQHMAGIYSSANKVYTWLGEDSSTLDGDHVLNASGGPIDNASWEKFATRRYFRRLWVVQELVYAPEILLVCGSSRMSFTDFVESVGKRASDPAASRDVLKFCNVVAQIYYNRDVFKKRRSRLSLERLRGIGPHALLQAMHAFQHLGCADDRDRVYSILSLCNETLSLDVDYSIPTAQVYYNVAKVLQGDDLLMMAAQQHSRNMRLDRDLPTWVPDWRIEFHILTWTRWTGQWLSMKDPHNDSPEAPVYRKESTVINDATKRLRRGFPHIGQAGNELNISILNKSHIDAVDSNCIRVLPDDHICGPVLYSQDNKRGYVFVLRPAPDLNHDLLVFGEVEALDTVRLAGLCCVDESFLGDRSGVHADIREFWIA